MDVEDSGASIGDVAGRVSSSDAKQSASLVSNMGVDLRGKDRERDETKVKVSSKTRAHQKPGHERVLSAKHGLHSVSEFKIYCPWAGGEDPDTVPSKACDELVYLSQFAAHLTTKHRIAVDSARRNSPKVACRLLLRNGGRCNKRVTQRGLTRHILSTARSAHIPIYSHHRLGREGGWGPKEKLKKLACKNCPKSFSVYVGGNSESFSRHMLKAHPELCF